jgi:hypothetical protein
MAEELAEVTAGDSEAQSVRSYGAESYAVGGRGFNDTEDYWTRLPVSAKCTQGEGCVRDIVWKLSLDSSGMFIQFKTDATAVGMAYTLRTDGQNANAPGPKLTAWTDFRQTGFSGADIYAWDEEAAEWGFLGTTMAGLKYPNASVLVRGIPAPAAGQLRMYRAHLPMYNAVEEVSVLASGGKVIEPDWSFRDGGKPIVWYGTSITQGGVSPRPGHAYTNRISRAIKREVLNLGFCGSGTMEISVAKHIATLDAALFIVDCDWNMDGATIAARAVPLARYLRGHGHPSTPIVFAEGSDWPAHWISNAPLGAGVAAKRAALEAAVANLTSSGDKHVHLVQGHELCESPSWQHLATFHQHRVPMCQLPDLGFFTMQMGKARQRTQRRTTMCTRRTSATGRSPSFTAIIFRRCLQARLRHRFTATGRPRRQLPLSQNRSSETTLLLPLH